MGYLDPSITLWRDRKYIEHRRTFYTHTPIHSQNVHSIGLRDFLHYDLATHLGFTRVGTSVQGGPGWV